MTGQRQHCSSCSRHHQLRTAAWHSWQRCCLAAAFFAHVCISAGLICSLATAWMPQKIPALHSCCRFDVRALLDFYKEPDPRVLAFRQKSSEELKLEQVGQLAQCCGDCFGDSDASWCGIWCSAEWSYKNKKKYELQSRCASVKLQVSAKCRP